MGYGWEAEQTTRAETRCGCFLPDLTGLARRSSAADLPTPHIMHPLPPRKRTAPKPRQRPCLAGAAAAWQGRPIPPPPGCPVTLIPATRPNMYTGSPLDRATEKREDAAFIAAALDSPEALFVLVWRSSSLMRGVAEGKPEAMFLTGEAAAALRLSAEPAGVPWAFLGMQGPQAVFGLDVSAVEDPLPLLPPGLGGFTDLRAAAGMLPGQAAAV